MKLIIFLSFVLTYSISIAQTNGGKITYGENMISMPIDTSKIKSKEVKFVIVNQMNAIKKALSGDNELYTLKFNLTKSTFEAISLLENDANPNLSRAISKGVYFTNLNEKINIRQLDAYDNVYLIKEELTERVWNISKETKKIGKYLCYKATTEIKNKKGIKTIITAWFTPDIPFSFGPKNYSGLPGLILSLYERGHHFYVKKISLSKKHFKIKQPKKGIEVTYNDFNKIGRKKMNKLKMN